MEQSSSVWLESEIETARILTDLRHTFSLFSHVPYSWGCRKKRSAIRNTPPSNGGGATTTVIPPPPDAVKAKVSSPTTPLSFPRTESDEKPKHSEKRTSLKRTKEHYLRIIEDLKKTKDSTTQEIANVKRQCEELKLFNSKLKAKQKELNINGPKGEYKIPNLEINNPMKLNDIIKNSANDSSFTTENTEQRIHHANNIGFDPTTSLGVASSSSSSLGRKIDNMGPLSIPDLNLSFEANIDLSKAWAAQARQRRIQILRLEKNVRNNAKQHQSSSSR
ncbi:uncharacterized protein LOC131596676 [Vicia villosa]|uniref:uncharacterized protein LOC131596676 n=1 Tax=Vicia villosa TaxID=3911 RepID=UPI00273BD92C|nr:uncharacterized protein LOC131596676 [Vicia villosa]